MSMEKLFSDRLTEQDHLKIFRCLSLVRNFEEKVRQSALAELRSPTGGLQAWLHETEAQFRLILRGFSSLLLFVHQFLNPRFCGLLSDFNPNLFLMCRLLC